jgi:Subtilase family
MADFPHLNFAQKIKAPYKHRPFPGGSLNERTQRNLDDRRRHAKDLTDSIDKLTKIWQYTLSERKEKGLPGLPNDNIIPLFLQVDPNKFDIEALKGFGIDIIAEEDNGYIIGAAALDFFKLRSKIERFVNEKATNPSQLWQIVNGLAWRVEHILSDGLQQKWESISDDEILTIEVSIACYIKIPAPPAQGDLPDGEYTVKYNKWLFRKKDVEIERTELEMQRQTEFETFVQQYGAVFLTGYENFEDSFITKIQIPGIGLKDMVFNYPYLFEVCEPEEFEAVAAMPARGVNSTLEVIAPDKDAPKICVIDSGIQEGHFLLQPAIIGSRSFSFVPGDADVSDKVSGGGHGTRVSGAILYPDEIPSTGQYQLPCHIINMRVLDDQNKLPGSLYPPFLMQQVFEKNTDIRIFNLSVSGMFSCRTTHMSAWAATVDKLMWENDILFLLSAGNLPWNFGFLKNPGILHYLHNTTQQYPDFLLNNASRIANPAQSCFALTVGSVCLSNYEDLDKKSFGDKDEPSSFSRTGLGIWGMIKPDVVEYGGDWIREKTDNNPNISITDAVCPQLVCAGGGAIGKDTIGTSFATPKVTSIAATLQNSFPELSALMYRALIIQSARWPDFAFTNPQLKWLRHFGYGIPNVNRATENTSSRITFIEEGKISPSNADIYTIQIPEQIRRQGDDYKILLEITLSYKANIRRTRQRTRSYLSTWLTWETSNLSDDTLADFKERIIKKLEEDVENEEFGEKPDDNQTITEKPPIRWAIGTKKNSSIKDVNRQDSTLQKDWALIDSFKLPKELCIAIVGHKGWEKDIKKEVPYAIAVSFEVLNSEINLYEMISVENEIRQEIQVNV